MKSWIVLFVLIPTPFAMLLCRSVAAEAAENHPPFNYLVAIDISGSMNDPLPAPVQVDLTRTSKLEDVRRRLGLLARYLPTGTRVLVTTFDHQQQSICDLILTSDEERRTLEQAFASIKSRDGSTYLWRTADSQLKRAEEIARNTPEGRVRVLLYTDGDDMEKAPGLDHLSLIRKYSDTLQSVVELDWVTLGYDLKPNMKSALASKGVRFTEATSPSDIVPVRAGFRLSSQVIEFGNSVTLVENSLGLEISSYTVNWGDGSAEEVNAPFIHEYRKSGRFVVRYAIRTKHGVSSNAEETVQVLLPEAPVARIGTSSEQVELGESLELTDETTSSAGVQSREWSNSGRVLSRDRSCRFTPSLAGEAKVMLVVRDTTGQTASATCVVQVRKPAAPVARIRLSKSRALPNEVVIGFDDSQGAAVVARHWTSADGQRSDAKTAEFRFTSPGIHEITLTLEDALGQKSSAKETVTIGLPEAPKAHFRLSTPKAKLGDTVTLINESSTSAVQYEWKIGNQKFNTQHVSWQVPAWGDVEVKLTATDQFGQAGTADAVLSVPRPAKPVAAILIPETAHTGEAVTFVDQSTGAIEGAGQWIVNQTVIGTGNSLTFRPENSGSISVERVVTGPGGESRISKRLTVSSPFTAPVAKFIPDRTSGRGRTTVQFRNESSGTIRQAVFDAGDGSPAKTVTDSPVFSHTFEPGIWTPTVIVRGVDEFPVAQWSPETSIQIARPIPAWVWNLFWQIPAAIAACGIAMPAVSFTRTASIEKRRMLLNGELTVRNPLEPLTCQQFFFEGEASEATVVIDRDRTLKLRTQCGDGDVHYVAELFQQDEEIDRAELEDSVDQPLGSFLLRYTA